MKLFYKQSLLASAWLIPAGAAIQLNPLWEIPAGVDTAVFPSYGSPTSSNSFDRGLAYNPVSGKVIVATRSGLDRVLVLNANRNNDPLDAVNEIYPLPVGNVILGVSPSATFSVNQVGVADDGAVYVANLIASSPANNPEGASFRVFRWQSDSAAEDNLPTIAFSGNPDSTGGIVRWGDTMAVRGSGVNTQILLGTNASTSTAVALLTTTDGLTFTSTIIPAAIGASNRGLTWGPPGENSFYSKSTGSSAPVRKTTFTLSPAPAAVSSVTTAIPSLVTGGTLGALNYNHASKRIAILDLTLSGFVSGQPWPFNDKDYIRLHDVNNTDGAVVAVPIVASKELTPETLIGTPGNGNAGNGNEAGAVAIGGGKVFVCSTNKGIQAFTIFDDAQITAPVASVAPATASVWTRGLLTLTGSATGTPPLTYQWLKNDQIIPGQTGLTLTINPVTAADAGNYKFRATNTTDPTKTSDSPACVVTTPTSLDTGALTKIWQLVPDARPWLTAGNTERGIDVNPAKGRAYVVSRAAPGLSVQVVNAADGAAIGPLLTTDITGGFSGFSLNLIGVADDGAIYACNLTDGSVPFKIYRWIDDDPATVPEELFANFPTTGRMGDSMDVRGSGENTEIVIGARNSNYILFKFVEGSLTAFDISIPDVPPLTFNTGIAFGNGNEVWGKSVGTYQAGDPPAAVPSPLVRTRFTVTDGVGSGELLATTPSAQILTTSYGLAFNPENNLIAFSGGELSDSVRLYQVQDVGTGTLTLLDQEFYATDNANINGVGAATFAGGKLYTLNTNNGIMAFNVSLPIAPELGALVRSGGNFSFTLTGTAGASYLIQRSIDMATWVDDGTVVLGAGVTTATVVRPASEDRVFFRARGL